MIFIWRLFKMFKLRISGLRKKLRNFYVIFGKFYEITRLHEFSRKSSANWSAVLSAQLSENRAINSETGWNCSLQENIDEIFGWIRDKRTIILLELDADIIIRDDLFNVF